MASDKASGRECHGIAIVAASVVVYIPVAGIINSFGIFVEQLNEEFCPFDCLQLLGWIGALTFGLNRAFCWMVVALQRVIPPFLLFVLGVMMCSASLFLASLVQRLPWLFLFYCLIYGFGSSLVMNTPYALIEDIFPVTHRHHVTATSIMNVGAPLGMLLVNPLVAYLDTLEGHTWRDTMRIFGLIVLFTGLVCSLPISRRTCHAIIARKLKKRSSKAGYEDIDKQIAEDGDLDDDNDSSNKSKPESSPAVMLCGDRAMTNLVCWAAGIFLLSVAIFIPKVHFIQYMHDLSIEPEVAAACMSYEGLAEAILSFMISVLGDPIAPYFLWMYALCTAILGIASCFLVYSTRVIHIAIYCTIHGAGDGLVMTTIYPTLPLFVSGTKAKQLLWSLTLFITGIGQVVGLPMAGLIYDETQSYRLVFYIASGAFCMSALLFAFIAGRGSRNGAETDKEIEIEAPRHTDQDEHLAINGNMDASAKQYSSTEESKTISSTGSETTESSKHFRTIPVAAGVEKSS